MKTDAKRKLRSRAPASEGNGEDPLAIPAAAVCIESGYAMRVAQAYIEMTETQLADRQAMAEKAELLTIRQTSDPMDPENRLGLDAIQRRFEDDYVPILRSTEVIYLYTLFEAFIIRHVDEIEAGRGNAAGILREIAKRSRCGLTEAAKIYFDRNLRWSLLEKSEWEIMFDISAVRNCLVHNAGIVRRTRYQANAYRLAAAGAGITILRYDDGRDAGQPMIIQREFIDYYLESLREVFGRLERRTLSQHRARHRKT